MSEQKDHNKFMHGRNDKINTQLIHLKNKQAQEMKSLEIKLDKIYKEQDGQRKQEQGVMLQRFINLKSELHSRQKVEESKLQNTLKIKNTRMQD